MAWLRSIGNDVLFAAEIAPGTADIRWMEFAEQERRVILTSDKDFGELVFRGGITSHGVVLLRLDDPGLTHHNSESGLHGKFRIPNKLKLLPYSLATFRWCCDQYSALLFPHDHMNILYFP